MLTDKQYRMLELLCGMITKCRRCGLYNGGRCEPYFTTQSKYVIVGEAPGLTEVRRNTPFIGPAGQLLWETIGAKTKLIKQDFGIINSVNCRPTDGIRNLKPSDNQMLSCKQWIRKFIKIINPERVLILGNYAMRTLLGKKTGIIKVNAADGILDIEFNKIPYMISVHPAYAMYDRDKGQKLLNESVKKFESMKKPIKIGFLDDSLFEI